MTRQLWAQLTGVVLLVAALVIISVSVGVPGVSRLRSDFAQFGVWAGVVYAALYAAVSLAPLPAAVFTLAAGALFGVTEGLIVVEAGATVGAVIGFWLARILGRDFVARLSGASVEKLDERFARRGVLAVLAVRLLPVLPFAAVNYVSGLTSIRFRDYLAGTVAGILPAAAAYVVLGAYGSSPGSVPFLVALGGLLVLVAVGLTAGQRNRRRRAASALAVNATPAADENGPAAS
ncbi:MAG: TVP38/TMEM64 family protein [Actinomycetota bacterium]|nr:TVP38/TMEM64 family protein [Actinomycetota bacterium]